MAFKRSAVQASLSPPKRPEIARFQVFFVPVKPRVRREVQKSLSDEADKKTPFAIIELRSANCRKKQKEDIQNEPE